MVPECVIFWITLEAMKITNNTSFEGIVYLTVKMLHFKCAVKLNENLFERMVNLLIASWINNNLLGLAFITTFQGCQW